MKGIPNRQKKNVIPKKDFKKDQSSFKKNKSRFKKKNG